MVKLGRNIVPRKRVVCSMRRRCEHLEFYWPCNRRLTAIQGLCEQPTDAVNDWRKVWKARAGWVRPYSKSETGDDATVHTSPT